VTFSLSDVSVVDIGLGFSNGFVSDKTFVVAAATASIIVF